MNWLQETKDGVVLTVKAVPRASKSEIAGADDDWLRVRVKAPPVDGKANEALVKFFATLFGVSKGAVTLVAGDVSRLKRIRVVDVSGAQVLAKLNA